MLVVETMTESDARQMTQEEYRALDAVNQSRLKTLQVSPELYCGRYVTGTIPPIKATPAMVFGSTVETYLRTGDHGCTLVPPEVLTSNGHRRGKAWEEWRDAQDSGRELLIQSEWNDRRIPDLERIAANIDAHEKARLLIRESEWHWRNVWCDASTGLTCKVEIDCVYHGLDSHVLADLKTTSDTSPEAFARQAANLGYDIQAAFYVDAYAEQHGRSLPYVLVCVRNVEPYDVEVYRMDDAFVDIGRRKYRSLIEDLARRVRQNDWKSATHGLICTLSKPRWYGVDDDR